LSAALYAFCTGCGLNVYNAMPRFVPVDPAGSAISRALAYLEVTQVTVEEESQTGGDFAGNWPQYFMAAALPEFRVRDVSPFMAAFIHHGLALVSEEHMAALQLLPEEVERARTLRRSAVTFMRRFQVPANDPAAGTIGFWPGLREPRTCQDFLLAAVFLRVLGGPQLLGSRSPANLTFYPPPLAIPTDADDTAMVYSAYLDDVRMDGGAMVDPPLDRYFTDWRDLGQVPRRVNPSWLPPASGAFLTWLAYNDPPGFQRPNDVDLVVNANVLFVLGRYGYAALAGVAESVALINAATLAGYHESRSDEVNLYYPPNYAFHYCISRAYAEGAIAALAPAVERLADELEASAQYADDGTVFWDRGDPHLNTALAALTLLNAGREGPVVDSAVAYLIDQQDPVYGHWSECVFFTGRTESGVEFVWRSSALATGMVLEALCRHRLASASSP